MGFSHRYIVPLPVDRTLAVHRDELPRFGPALPGVGEVRLTGSHRTQDGVEVLEHRWQGDLSAIPRLLRSAIDHRAFQWTDHTRWDADAARCDWRMDVPVLGEGVHMDGRYTFRPVPGGTEVHVEAALTFAPGADAPFASSALGRRMLPVVERFVQALFRRVMDQSSQVISAHAARTEPALAA